MAALRAAGGAAGCVAAHAGQAPRPPAPRAPAGDRPRRAARRAPAASPRGGGARHAPAVERNPFLFLAAITGAPGCSAKVTGLAPLAADLAAAADQAPAFTLIVPDACGGGRVGAIVPSAHVKGAVVSDVPYDHFALLRTIEVAFGLRHLGLAGAATLEPFGKDIFGAG